jgi:hypothetical protein
MSKTALLEVPKPAGPVPCREVKIVWAHRETPLCCSGSAKQAPPPAPTLAVRLRAHLSSLTALEACALFTLIHRRATGEDTLLKCAAAETGVSEALIVKIAKKLGFEGFRQLREALGEHNRLAQTDLHEELCVAEGACARLQKVLRAFEAKGRGRFAVRRQRRIWNFDAHSSLGFAEGNGRNQSQHCHILFAEARLLRLGEGGRSSGCVPLRRRNSVPNLVAFYVPLLEYPLLDAITFLARVLQHVLPAGFHKVRYYGWLHPRARKRFYWSKPCSPAAILSKDNRGEPAPPPHLRCP